VINRQKRRRRGPLAVSGVVTVHRRGAPPGGHSTKGGRTLFLHVSGAFGAPIAVQGEKARKC